MKKQIIIILITLISIGVIGFLLWSQSTSAEPLTEESAKQLVDERYGGEITGIQLVNNQFLINITLPTGTYELKIDRTNGDVISMQQTKAIEVKEELTEEEVRKAVDGTEPGEIQEIKKIKNENQNYYEVNMESKEVKTTLSIDAQTGEILSRNEERIEGEQKKQSEGTPDKEQEKPFDKESKKQQEQQKQSGKKEDYVSQKNVRGITEADAMFIALETVDPKRIGEIDDVDLEEVDGEIYYFVEVEFDSGEEAVVQINAITSEVKKINWDD